MDHMAVIHDVAAPLVAISPAARQGHEMGGSEVKVEPVIMPPDAQAVADQAGRHGVEDPPEDEAAGRRHGDMGLFTVRGAAGRQRLQHRALGVDALAIVGAAHDRRTRQGTGGKRRDRRSQACRAAEAHPRSLASGAHVAPRSRHSHASSHRGAIGSSPMARAAVVPARRHGVMAAQRFVAQRPVGGGVTFKVAEG